MADDGFGFQLGLEDAVSVPAKSASVSLGALKNSLDAVERSMTAMVKQQQKVALAAAATENVAKANKQAWDALNESTKKSGSFFEDLGKNLTGGLVPALLVADAIKEIARATEHAVVGGTMFAIEAAEFKENTTVAYEAVQGTAEEGEKTFAQIDKLSRAIHMPAREAHELAGELMLQGLEDTKLVGAALTATSDLIREGQTKGATKLRAIIEKSLAAGHFEVKGLEKGKGAGIAGLGVHVPDLIADIAKRTGQSVEQVKSQLKAGKVATEVGIAAITDAIDQGSIGQAAHKKFGLADFKTDVVNTFTEIAQNVDMGNFTQSLVDAEAAVTGLSGQEGGLKTVFQVLVDGAAAGIDGLVAFGQEGEILVLEMQVATLGMGDLGSAIGEVGSVAGEIVTVGLVVLKDGIIGIIEVVDDLTTGVEELGAVLGFVFSGDAFDFGHITEHFEALKKTVGELEEGASERRDRRADLIFGDPNKAGDSTAIRRGGAREPVEIGIGKDVGLGMAKGVGQASPEVETAVANTVKKGEDAGRDAAQSHSPSELFANFGRDLSDGIVMGFDTEALTKAVRTTVHSAVPAARSAGGGSDTGASGATLNWYGDLIVNGEVDEGSLRHLAEGAFTDAFERFATELGGGG